MEKSAYETFTQTPDTQIKRKVKDVRVGDEVTYNNGTKKGLVIKSDAGHFLISTEKGYDFVPAAEVSKTSEMTEFGHWDDMPNDLRKAVLLETGSPEQYIFREWTTLPSVMKDILTTYNFKKADTGGGSGTGSQAAYETQGNPSSINDFGTGKKAKKINKEGTPDEATHGEGHKASKVTEINRQPRSVPVEENNVGQAGDQIGYQQGQGNNSIRKANHKKISDNVVTPEDYKPKTEPKTGEDSKATSENTESHYTSDYVKSLIMETKEALSTGSSGAHNPTTSGKNEREAREGQNQDTNPLAEATNSVEKMPMSKVGVPTSYMPSGVRPITKALAEKFGLKV